MHALDALSAEVDRTHPGLGGLIAATVLAARAHQLVLVVAASGCGKSSAGLYVRATREGVRYSDMLTSAGLDAIAEDLTDFRGTIVVDDLGKVSPYGRVHTICTMAELVYSHFVERHAYRVNTSIQNFQGSGIVACQPSVLKRVYEAPEWESNIADKTLRFYHLYRPTEPNSATPPAPFDWHDNVPDDSSAPLPAGAIWDRLVRIGETQWSRARTQEHMGSLVRAAAVLDGRATPDKRDLDVTWRLLRPMLVETVVTQKSSFEEGRVLDSNLLCLLVEFATYGATPLDVLCRDYHLNPASAEGLILGLNKYSRLERKSPATIYPTKLTEGILERLGVAHYQKETSTDGGDTGSASPGRRNGHARGATDTDQRAPAVREEHARKGADKADRATPAVRRNQVHPGGGAEPAAPGRASRPREAD